MKGFPKSEENLIENKNGYHVFGQNIKYQYPQKVLLNSKYLHYVDPKKPILAYTSSAGEIGIIKESFYRSGNNGAFQGLFPKFKNYNYKHLLFILNSIQKLFNNYNYSTSMSDVINLIIKLPTKNGNIDYDFMDTFVAELEAQRVAELEAYLETTGLNDYELTDEEKKILSLSEKTASNEVRHSADNAKNETIKFKDFKITDIFEIKNTKSIIRSKIIPGSGTTPYLTASEQNNSISTYIHCSENMIDKGHCLFIGGKTLVITYQKKDFCSNDSHNLALYYKGNYFLSDKEQLYFCGALNKALLHKYSWDNSISKTKIKNNIIRLPINKQNKIDFDYMEKYITAIEKLIIKNVVEYKDKLVDQTKKLVD